MSLPLFVKAMLTNDSGEAGEQSETEGADCEAIGDWGIFNNNAEAETNEKEKISPSALQAATPLYERGSLEMQAPTCFSNDDFGSTLK